MTDPFIQNPILGIFLRWRCHSVCYISGCDLLPAPFTREEETDLVQKFQNGDTEARSALIEHNLRLVVFIAKKFESTGLGIEDLISIGTIGLMKAINSFDLEKNIKLSTYASRCIENEILMVLRHSSRYRQEVSFDEPVNIDLEGNELLISDVLGTEPDLVSKELDECEDRQMLRVAVTHLNRRDRNIVSLRYGLGGGKECTQKEVADILGISQSYISRLEKRIMLKLRSELERQRA